jgi:predicted dehydrogenase
MKGGLMGLQQPLDIALIGAGRRAQTVYCPLFAALRPWVRIAAVCDPVRENADAVAGRLGAAAYSSIFDLVRDRPMEAALVVTPIDSHYPISCYLSAHGIHNLVETSMCSLLAQGRAMIRVARERGVVLRVAENFVRFPFDRIARQIAATGFLGDIGRLTCLHDHLGYHNNSRWISFYGAYPESVQAIAHRMPVAPHYERPTRFHEHEAFGARFYRFPGDRLATDLAGNIKGLLGRYPRPGYTEIDGARGAIVRYMTRPWHADAEVRYCSDEALQHGGVADQIYPIVQTTKDGVWHSTHVDLPVGRVEYVNPYRPTEAADVSARDYYGAVVMDEIVDFARAAREGAPSLYTAEDALMALMMEVGARESVLRDGARVPLPLDGDVEAERRTRTALRTQHGVDPFDVEAMLAISYTRR